MRSSALIPGLCFSLATVVAGCSRATERTPLPIVSVRVDVAAETADPTGVAFAQDEGGRLALERLAAGRGDALAPVPFVESPRPWRTARLERLPMLPDGAIEAPPVALNLTGAGVLATRTHAALDVPPLAMGDKAPSPALPVLPIAPKIRVESPDPLKFPAPMTPARPPEPLLPAVDPTDNTSRQAALAVIGVLRVEPAPFVRLTIPDPFENLKAVQLRSTPPEPIEPAAPTGRPPVTAMPVK